MALSGNINTNKYTTSSHGTIGLNLSWTGVQDIAANTTKISWTLKSNGTMSSGYSVQGGPITVTIGGKTVLSITSRVKVNGSGGFKKTGTVTISHNEDGTKSCAMSVKAALYSASVNCTASYTYTLDKINRYALLGTVEDFTDEGNPTITYTNPAGTDLVTNLKVRITWNSGANYTAWNNLSDEGGTFTFSLSGAERTSMLSACPTANQLEIQYDLQSELNGTEYHNYKTAVMNVVNADPTSGAMTYQDTDAAIVAITGSNQIIVQGQSTLQIHTAAATANKGASISSYALDFNGQTYTPDGSGNVSIVKPNFSGSYAATVTTTDSRGNTSTASVTVPVTAWSLPTATITLERVNGFETNTTLTVDGNISTVTGSTMAIKERHKKEGGSWSAYASVTDNTPTTLLLDRDYVCTVEIVVSDAFASSTFTNTVGRGIPLMFIDTEKKSASVNGFPDDDEQFYVDGHIKVTGAVLCDKVCTTNQFTSLWTGTLTSGEARVNYGDYSAYLIKWRTSTNGNYQTMMIPMIDVASTNQRFQFSTESAFYSFDVKYEGDELVVAFANATTSSTSYIAQIYGIY